MIEAIAVSYQNGFTHTLCKTVFPIAFDAVVLIWLTLQLNHKSNFCDYANHDPPPSQHSQAYRQWLNQPHKAVSDIAMPDALPMLPIRPNGAPIKTNLFL
ncbi:MAG TPA: hypothetical protein HPP76_07355 [Desulfuromonadales bacterium]|nr:hypothetical protein [Desulfuromonadales bacterium]